MHTPTLAVQVDFQVANQRSARYAIDKPLGAAFHVGQGGDVRHHHDELVAAEPAQRVRAAQRLPHPFRHADQNFVAGAVAQRVVHPLEVVQVDDEHADLATVQHRLFDGVGDALAQQGAARQAGQLVVGGHVVEVGHQLFAFRDVGSDRDESTDLARAVHHGRYSDMHRQRGAVIADVGPLALVDLAQGRLGRQQVEAFEPRFVVGALCQDGGSFAWVVEAGQRHFLTISSTRITGQPFGRRVHRLDHAGMVCLDNAVRSVFEDRVTEIREALVALFGGLEFGGIAGSMATPSPSLFTRWRSHSLYHRPAGSSIPRIEARLRAPLAKFVEEPIGAILGKNHAQSWFSSFSRGVSTTLQHGSSRKQSESQRCRRHGSARHPG